MKQPRVKIFDIDGKDFGYKKIVSIHFYSKGISAITVDFEELDKDYLWLFKKDDYLYNEFGHLKCKISEIDFN